MEEGHGANGRFYSDCGAYFGHLRRAGRSDHGFEDEFYFTMPAVSGGRCPTRPEPGPESLQGPPGS